MHKNEVPLDYKEPISDVQVFSPAWVSFLFPVGTIVSGANVNLNIDLGQINSNNYNWKEFSKIILSLPDINANDLPVLITVDGAIMLPNSEKYYSQEIAIGEINKIRSALFLGGILVKQIDINDLQQGSVEEGGKYTFIYNPSFHNRVRLGGTSLSERIVLSHLDRIDVTQINNSYLRGMNYRNSFHFDVTFLINGYFYLLNYNLAGALNNLWICVEQLTKLIWNNNADLKLIETSKQLKKNPKWIGVKHEVLSIHNIISNDIFNVLDNARNLRNDLLHDSKLPRLDVIESLWIILFDLIEIAYEIKLNELHSKTISIKKENIKSFIRFNTFYKTETIKRKRNFDDWNF